MSKTYTEMFTTRKGILKMVFVAIIGVFALAGCIKVDSATNISSDSKISGSLYYGIDLSALKSMSSDFNGANSQSSDINSNDMEEQLKQQIEKQKNTGKLPRNVNAVYKKDGKYSGIELIFDQMPLPEYQDLVSKAKAATEEGNNPQSPVDTSKISFPTIVKNGNTFTYTYDTAGLSPSTGGNSSMDFSQAAPSLVPVINLKVTFPGKVESSNGTISANTVTWDYNQIKNLNGQPATATGKASAGSLPTILFILAAIIVAVILLAVIIVLIFVGRKKKSAAPTVENPAYPTQQGDMGNVAPPIVQQPADTTPPVSPETQQPSSGNNSTETQN